MKVVSGLHELPDDTLFDLTLGNFDGFHLGHQYLLKNILDQCHQRKTDFVLATFIPHPQGVLNPEKFLLINTYEERREFLSEFSVKYLCEIPFNQEFSQMSGEDFLEKYIFISQKPKKLYLGHDFAFGAHRSGTKELAQSYCQKHGVEFEAMAKFDKNGQRVSSGLIRSMLSTGRVDEVRPYLGRPYFVRGEVIRGDGRGKGLGFPTANLFYGPQRAFPAFGVYLTETVVRRAKYFSLTNIGVRPTFQTSKTIETHILDFNEDIYGEIIQNNFLKKIRDEKKFHSAPELISQIRADIAAALAFFRHD